MNKIILCVYNGMFFDEIQSYIDNTDFGEIKLDFYIGDISKIEVLKTVPIFSELSESNLKSVVNKMVSKRISSYLLKKTG